MRSTLCKLFLVPAIAAVAALASQSAQAETVDVPFAFTALGHSYPAGDYNVEKDLNTNFVVLRQHDGSRILSRVLGPGDADHGDTRVVLRFNEGGDGHVLDSIQFGSKITSHLTTNRDRERVSRMASGQ